MITVAANLYALRREHRLARIRARYDELLAAYDEAGAAINRCVARIRMWAVTGEMNAEGALLVDVARLDDAIQRLNLHQVPEEVRAALLHIAEGIAQMTQQPNRATAIEVSSDVQDRQGDYYRLAGAHLRRIWPRPQSID